MAEFAGPACADIIARLPIGVFTVDSNWRIDFWNARLVDWTGIGADRASGHPLGEILPRLAERQNFSRLETVMAGGVLSTRSSIPSFTSVSGAPGLSIASDAVRRSS